MAGKRKLIRKRTARKTKPKKTNTIENYFKVTKEEEKEPLAVHIEPSPEKPGIGKKRNVSDFADIISTDKDNQETNNEDEKENKMIANNEADLDEDISPEEDPSNKFEVRQRVLARDEDGILYYSNVRRKLLGINHQKTISSLGIFDLTPDQLTKKENNKENEGENESTTGESEEKEWHYFVHYEGWKALFDRWVSEKDILEITPENVERMKEISKAHKTFQLEFKEKTKKRKIQNGGLFLQQWKQRLDALDRRWEEKTNSEQGKGKESKESPTTKKRKGAVAAAKKKNSKSPQEMLRDRSKLAVQSCLTIRQVSHIQAIPLSFALKRILVEDWENLNNASFAAENNRKEASDENLDWDMVHVLPAKVTIRDALTLYLKEKGVSWEGKPTETNQSKNVKVESNDAIPNESTPSTELEEKTAKEETRDSNITPSPPDNVTSAIGEEKDATTDKTDELNKGISIQLVKEWTDMANGIVLYFEQALMARLLYPSEISQLLVLEDNLNENESMPLKVDIYGCEHLLRLLSSIPRILDQQLQESRKRKLERKQQSSKQQENKQDEDADQEDAFVEIGSMILAKLQDLSRFLQKNQSALFRSMYRKKNEQEIKRDIKIQKRQDRRLKSLAAAAAAVSSENQAENSPTKEWEANDAIYLHDGLILAYIQFKDSLKKDIVLLAFLV